MYKYILNKHTTTQRKKTNKLAISASTSILFLALLIEYFEASKRPDAAIWQTFARLEDANKTQYISTNITLQKLLSRKSSSSNSSRVKVQTEKQKL